MQPPMSEFRRRNNIATTVEDNDAIPLSRATIDDGMNASILLKSSPTQHSQVMKLNIPLIYSFAPGWLRNVLRYCPGPFKPSWKQRYLIQIGKYLYRFSYKNTASQSAAPLMKSKGSPIPLDQIQVRLISKSNILLDYECEIRALRDDLPSFCDGFFSITFGGDTKYYACQTEQDAVTWCNSLQEGRQSVITVNMGHDKRPYPKKWKYIDFIGEQLYKRKDRIKEALRRSDMDQLDMIDINNGQLSHGTMPRGFYG